MKTILYLHLTILLLTLTGASSVFPFETLEILSSSDREFHFRKAIDLPSLDFELESDSLRSYYNLVLVGVPHGATVRLESAAGSSLQPFHGHLDVYARQSAVRHPLVELSDVYTVRNRNIVSVRINPATPQGWYESVDVRLAFSGGRSTAGSVSADPHFDRIFETALANHDVCLNWPVPARPLTKPTAGSGPFTGAEQWFKIFINQNGLHRVNGADLENAGLALTDIPAESIRLYAGGGKPLPVDNDVTRPQFTEVAILIDDGGDGVFDRHDDLFFYGEAVDRWLFEAGFSPYFLDNRYEQENCYWLKITQDPGLRMAQIDAAPGGSVDTVVTTFRRRIHIEQDNLLRVADGRTRDYFTWYWTDQSSLTFFVNTPGAVPDDVAQFVLHGRTFAPGFMQMSVNDLPTADTCSQFNCRTAVWWLRDGSNKVDLQLSGSSNTKPYFNFLDLEYSSYLTPVSNELDVPLDPYTGRAEISVVDDFDNPVIILDLADPRRPELLNNFSRMGGNILFAVDLQTDAPNRFYVTTTQEARSPVSVRWVEPVDLYSTDKQSDLIIVTTESLAGALDEYVAYREAQGYSISVALVDDIYDNFSFGLFDPTAVRDFLKYAYEYFPPPEPSAVLFVGDGNYDYLDILQTGVPNWVPSYLRPNDESASDDNYVYFGSYGILDSDTSYITGGRGFDMLTARWPVRSAAEIEAIVGKMKQYESAATFGPWRNEITLVADDEYGHFDTETFHTTQTEELEKNHIPANFRRHKIYLWEFPFVNREKPDVNDDIVKAINDGTLLINYVGHGNPDVWAHEHVFTRDADVARLSNFDKLPLVFTASCAIGFFDDPRREGMAEDLLVHPSGGAVAVVSATRLVYASENAAFNRKVFDILLTDDSLSIAESVYLAKLERQYRVSNVPLPVRNDRAYLVLGDPFLRLALPRLDIEFTEFPDSLTALEKVRVSGTVVSGPSEPYRADGKLIINVFDSEREKTYRLVNDTGGTVQEIDYTVNGPSIYRGSASIAQGEFDFEFIVPRDITYGGSGAEIGVYTQFADIDGVGKIDSLDIAVSAAATSDSVGPTIEYRIPSRHQFVSGDEIAATDQLQLVLSDPSGINLTGALGHGITMTVDERTESTVNLTSLFAYDQDDYTRGRIMYRFEDLSVGHHNFKIKAWDNANNSSSTQFTAQATGPRQLAILDLLNYPNPMKERTTFSYRLTDRVERISLAIFTLSGRQIKSFERYPGEAGYYDDIVWHGDDFSGDRIATGVYIYKATAIPAGGGEAVEAFGKVVVVN